MLKKHAWRIIAVIGLLALFASRIYFSTEKHEQIEKQQHLIEDLSRQQLRERLESPAPMDLQIRETQKELAEKKARLDSLRIDMEKKQKEFQKRMNALQNKE